MESLHFYLKKIQDLEYSGDWKEHYLYVIEHVHQIIDRSHFSKRSEYIKDLESLNEKILELPFSGGSDSRLKFRHLQKDIIDLLYKVESENKKIFISGDPDGEHREKVASFLGKHHLDFAFVDPSDEHYDLDEFLKEARDCDFAIILYFSEKEHLPFNIQFDLGYFTSHAGRKNILVFTKPGQNFPFPYEPDKLTIRSFEKGEWKNVLLEEIKKAGIHVEQSEKV